MTHAAGEVPDKPAVDGSEGEFAALGFVACAGHVVEYPTNFGGGEVWIEDKAGFRGDGLTMSTLFERRAHGRGTAILPDDGGVDRLARGALPDDYRFALVGDANGSYVAWACSDFP